MPPWLMTVAFPSRDVARPVADLTNLSPLRRAAKAGKLLGGLLVLLANKDSGTEPLYHNKTKKEAKDDGNRDGAAEGPKEPPRRRFERLIY